ncbi:MAG: hypothetical protein EAX91_13535 [Candidatus Lokiarchaeota archaeon]|nr:hypothetical protein [Candidatus Lokiarchaeota archaeon]
MDITQIDYIITQLGLFLDGLLIPFATFILGRKLLKQKKATGKYNPIRVLIFGVFFSFSVLGIIELILEYMPGLTLLDEWFGSGITNFNIYGFLIGTMVTFGLTMIFFAYRWESLQYSALFFYGGMIVFFFLTGYDAWLEMYIIITGLAGVIFLYVTGIRVKDNGALGLAIFFTIAFVTIAIDFGDATLNHWVTQISILVYSAFILVFSLGYFRVFKEGGK